MGARAQATVQFPVAFWIGLLFFTVIKICNLRPWHPDNGLSSMGQRSIETTRKVNNRISGI